MRILQVVSRPQRRGAEVFALDLCRALESRGHLSRIVYLYAPPDPSAALELRATDRALGGDPAHPFERVPGWQPRLLRGLLQAVDEFAPDVVQLNGSRTVKYGSLVRRLRRRAPWVVTYRSIGAPSDWLRGRLRRALYRRLVISALDGIVAVSEATQRDLAAVHRPEAPTATIPRGVDLERLETTAEPSRLRAELGIPDDRAVLLFVGSLTAEKRPDRLLRIAAAVAAARAPAADPEPRTELWVVGAGPLEAQIADAVAAPPRNLVVRWFGSRAEVSSFLAAADLLLLTSDTEGTPGVVLEAGALGTPAVAAAVGGVGECIDHGHTGLVAAPGDEAALAEAATSLLADPERLGRLGEAARCLVARRFSMPRIVALYEDHYRTLLGARSRRATRERHRNPP